MYPYLKNKNKIPLRESTKNEIVKNTKAMIMHKIGGTVVGATDNLLISSLVNLKSVGLYPNYFFITNALTLIFSQIFKSITASVGNLFASSDKDRSFNIFKKINFVNFWIYSVSSVCLLCLFNPFIKLWVGEQYLFPIDIVLIIVINFYITGMRKTVLTFCEAFGLFYKDRWKAIVEACYNLLVSIPLALEFGTFGVFLSTFISSIFTCVWVTIYFM